MAEYKNTEFDRPGGYAMPKGIRGNGRDSAGLIDDGDVKLFGDGVDRYEPPTQVVMPFRSATEPDTRLYLGDCRDVLANLPEKGQVDLIFADPPFNWDVPYDQWHDGMPRRDASKLA